MTLILCDFGCSSCSGSCSYQEELRGGYRVLLWMSWGASIFSRLDNPGFYCSQALYCISQLYELKILCYLVSLQDYFLFYAAIL